MQPRAARGLSGGWCAAPTPVVRYAPMLWKILLTALVIGGALLVLRRRGRSPAPQPPPRLEASSGGRDRPRQAARWIAAGFLLLMLAGSGAYLFHVWRDNYRVVEVRVIDSRSGRSVTYQAYKGDVEGRSFVTTDGRRVSLAEVERLELGAGRRGVPGE